MNEIDNLILQNAEAQDTLKNIEINSDYQLLKADEISEGIKDLNGNIESLILLSEKEEKPEVEKVEIVNFPEPAPFPEMPEYPSEISISNLPDVQKVEIINLPEDKDDKETNALLKTLIDEVKKKEECEYDVQIDSDLRESLKGDDGYTPVKGVDYFDGEKGDKGDKGDKGEPGKDVDSDIVDELQSKVNQALSKASMTVSLKELDDVNLNGLTQTDGKYNLGSGGTPATYTPGSVLFAGADGTPTEDNTNLFYDNTNNYLGIGTNTPDARLDVKGDALTDGATTANLANTIAVYSGSYTGSNTDTDGILVPVSVSLPPPYSTTITFASTAGIATRLVLTLKVTAGLSQSYIRVNGILVANGTVRTTGTHTIEYFFVSAASNTIDYHCRTASAFHKTEIKQAISPMLPLSSFKDSTGAARIELRASTSAGNTFMGVNSAPDGLFLTNSLGFGDNTLSSMLGGTGNIAVGPNAGDEMYIGNNNMVFGTAGGPSGITYDNIVPSNNYIGGLKNVLSGSNNTTLGTTTGGVDTATATGNTVLGVGGMTGQITSAPNMVVGNAYVISLVGTTDFTLCGASANLLGVTFICTAVGTGTGRAYLEGRAASLKANAVNSNMLINATAINVNAWLNNTLINTSYTNAYRLLRSSFINTTTTPSRSAYITTAGGFVVGVEYVIVSLGTTDFTLIGALTPSIGVIFTATGAGTGTGTAIATRIHAVATGDLALGRDVGMASLKANTAYGVQAGYSIIVGNGNVANGYQALGGAGTTSTVTAPNIVAGFQYIIATLGTTDFTLYGATANIQGLIFTATGAGLGTGTATLIVEDNVANGERALFACIGRRNVANGYNTLADVTRGDSNTGYGHNTGRGITTGRANTIIGANQTGFAAGDSNLISISDGDGVKRIQTSAAGHTTFDGLVRTRTCTVATLPVATLGVGFRAFVTDSLAPVWGAAVVGGGAVPVPVYSDGTVWRVG